MTNETGNWHLSEALGANLLQTETAGRVSQQRDAGYFGARRIGDSLRLSRPYTPYLEAAAHSYMVMRMRDTLATVGAGTAAFGLSLLTCLVSAQLAVIVSVALATTILVALHLAVFRRTQAWIAAELFRSYRQNESLAYLVSCLRPREALPPMRNWAVSPDFANLLISLINESKPHHIVELGSGVSTLVCGYSLERIGGGSIVSLDHDLTYSQTSVQRLKSHCLEKFAAVRYAPLVESRIGADAWEWYDLKNVDMPSTIDLLVVDGPPTKPNGLNRYPALPLLYQHLSDRAIIVLDDGIREEEQEVVRRWVSEFEDLQVEYVDLEAGAFVLRRNRRRCRS